MYNTSMPLSQYYKVLCLELFINIKYIKDMCLLFLPSSLSISIFYFIQ